MTMDQLLRQCVREDGLPRSEARALLALATGRSAEWLVAHDADEADDPSAVRFAALAKRRAEGEPMAYLTGVRDFFGRPFRVTPAVLIPRHETELLVTVALAAIAGIATPRLLDLGTGSGALAVTLAVERPDAVVVATDLFAPALAVAHANAAALGARGISFRAGHWWQALDENDRPFHLIVANPPYVAAGDPHLAAGDLRFEPRHALSAGPLGEDDLRQIIAHAPAWLRPGGQLALEHGYSQGAACRRMMGEHGFSDILTHTDLEHRERVTACRLICVPGAVSVF